MGNTGDGEGGVRGGEGRGGGRVGRARGTMGQYR